MSYLALNTGGKWSPWLDLRREMDQLFGDFLASSGAVPALAETSPQWGPLCDVEESDDHYLIAVEMPGVPKDAIQVEFRDNQITISGERRQERRPDDGARWHSERRFGRFQRSFMIPSGVDPDKLEASYVDGVLRVYIPKAESARPRRIKVTHGSGAGFMEKLLGSTRKDPDKISDARIEKVA